MLGFHDALLGSLSLTCQHIYLPDDYERKSQSSKTGRLSKTSSTTAFGQFSDSANLGILNVLPCLEHLTIICSTVCALMLGKPRNGAWA